MFDKKGYFILTMAVPALVATTADRAFAETFLTHEQALEFAFGKEAKSETEVKSLTPEQKTEFQKKLGFPFDPNKTDFTFYKGLVNGEVVMYAYIDVVPGKWGPITYVIVITPEGKVRDMSVTELMERRGRPVKERRFLDQFIGKTTESNMVLNKDIKQVAGATISSTGMNNGVRKVLALFKHFYPPAEVINKTDEVLKNVFPKEAKVKSEAVTIQEKDMEGLKKQYGAAVQFLPAEKLVVYVDEKEPTPSVSALTYSVKGKNNSTVNYLVGLSPDEKINQCYILSLTDPKDNPVADKAFLEQFNGKGLEELLQLNLEKDIKNAEALSNVSQNFVQGLRKSLIFVKTLKNNGKQQGASDPAAPADKSASK
ncbi:MAG: FMN-binding protein [Planctomycetes bacterium]|nr:FMN-binding protein [Planctomycetota bacterium]